MRPLLTDGALVPAFVVDRREVQALVHDRTDPIRFWGTVRHLVVSTRGTTAAGVLLIVVRPGEVSIADGTADAICRGGAWRCFIQAGCAVFTWPPPRLVAARVVALFNRAAHAVRPGRAGRCLVPTRAAVRALVPGIVVCRRIMILAHIATNAVRRGRTGCRLELADAALRAAAHRDARRRCITRVRADAPPLVLIALPLPGNGRGERRCASRTVRTGIAAGSIAIVAAVVLAKQSELATRKFEHMRLEHTRSGLGRRKNSHTGGEGHGARTARGQRRAGNRSLQTRQSDCGVCAKT